MYMALFSGGRWVRQLLLRAGPEFWSGTDAALHGNTGEKLPEPPDKMSGFSFLAFDDGLDGASIKAEFKLRLAEAEALLDERERRDVVAAAKTLFQDCIALVGILDREIGADVVWTVVRSTFGYTAAFVLVLFSFWLGARFWIRHA